MLVLNRKKGEKVTISDDIIVTVVETCGTMTRLGFDAPDHVKVLRTELAGTANAETTKVRRSFTPDQAAYLVAALKTKSCHPTAICLELDWTIEKAEEICQSLVEVMEH